MLELLTAGAKKPTSNFKVASYDGGKYNLAVVEKGGTLWFLGNQNNSGDMGSGDLTNPVGWYQSPITDVKDVWKNGSVRTIVRKNDGTIWYCGKVINRYQMGIDTGANNANITTWTDISSAMPVPLSQIKYVKPGYSSTVVLTTDGRVFWCGANQDGHFGNGTTATATSFTQTTLSFFAQDVHVCPDFPGGGASQQTSVIITDEGLGYAAGTNANKLVNNTSTTGFTSYTSMSGSLKFNKVLMSAQLLFAHVSNISNGVETLVYSGYNSVVGGSSTTPQNLGSARGASGTFSIPRHFAIDYTGVISTGNAVLFTLQQISTGLYQALCAGSSARNITNTSTLQIGQTKTFPPAGESSGNGNFELISLGASIGTIYSIGCIYSDVNGDRLYGLGSVFGQAVMDNAPFIPYAWPVI